MPLSQIVSASIEDGAVAPVDLSSVAQYYGYKNRLINGAMGIWQRGTSGFTTLSNYCADRWFVSSGGSLSAVSRSTDVPTGFQYSLSVTGTNVQSIGQRIESVNCTDLVGHNVTVSFWAKQTSGAGSNSISLQLWYANTPDTFGSITQIGSTGTFNGTSSWAQYSLTFSSLPANVVNGVLVVLYSGGSSTILVTGLQLEKGVTATSFDYRPFGTELQLCQRYYYQSTNYGAAMNYSQSDFNVYGPLSAANNWLWASQRLQVPMRVAPTVTTSDQTGTTGKLSLFTSAGGATSNGTTPYTIYTTPNIYLVSVYTESKYGFFGAIKADAEL